MKSAPSSAVCSVNIGSLLQKLWCFDQHYHLNRCCLLRALLLAVPSDIKKKTNKTVQLGIDLIYNFLLYFYVLRLKFCFFVKSDLSRFGLE